MQPRFPLLDSVRAIAALSVLVFHASFWSEITLTGSDRAPFLSRLDVGVTIFFVLSGFLLYRPFVRARLLGTPPPRAIAYGWRRVLRIVPAYWLALTVIALVIPKPDTFEPGHALVYYGFLQIYGDLALGGITPGVDAVRGGDVLRAAAAVGARRCVACPRRCAASWSRWGRWRRSAPPGSSSRS